MTGTIDWREEPISRHHDRKGFDCGSAELNDYLERFARQNHESGGAKSFVAVPPSEPRRVLGGDLLLAAGVRALSVAAQVGGVALAIDAKDERAAKWYERFGALRLLDDPSKLVLPLDTIAAAVAATQRQQE